MQTSKISNRCASLFPVSKKVVGGVAAVAAAGLGAHEANGAIIYTTANASVSSSSTSANLNMVHTADFVISWSAASGITLNKGSANSSLEQNGFASVGSAFPLIVRALTVGDSVKSDLAAGSYSNVAGTLLSYNGGSPIGQALPGSGEEYFGITLNTYASGQYYGWVGFTGLNDSSAATTSGTLVDYGFNNTVGTDITVGAGQSVPEPTSLALLGMGAAGLLTYRGRRAK